MEIPRALEKYIGFSIVKMTHFVGSEMERNSDEVRHSLVSVAKDAYIIAFTYLSMPVFQ